ncbi:hypothetical protein ASE98_11585 [Pseudomonas sp. Leaf48]|nr:hypothetical protein ASE98_11585 [Pseudomonas sp. Leaf48]
MLKVIAGTSGHFAQFVVEQANTAAIRLLHAAEQGPQKLHVAATHGAMLERGHAEPQRGTEWWGKSLLVTFGLFKK